MPYVLKYHDIPCDIHLDTIVVREVNAILNKDFSSLNAPELKILYDADDLLSTWDNSTEEYKPKLAELFNFVCTHEEVSIVGMVAFIRIIVQKSFGMSFKDFPDFQEFVAKFAPLTQAALKYKEEP